MRHYVNMTGKPAQHHTFINGETVTHGQTMPTSACKFSLWHDQDKQLKDGARIDALGRTYPLTVAQFAYFERHRPAWLV